MRFPIATLFAALANVCAAEGFVCSVHEVYVLTDSGEMRRDKGYEELLVGRQFSVDRTRGTITGYPMDNSYSTEIRVIHPGNEANSFKVLSLRASDDPYYLKVDVYKPGREKPFIGTKGREVFAGTCTAL